MTPRAAPERLEKRLARVAKEQGIDQERLRRWVSFLALCGVLERAFEEGALSRYYLKGGVAKATVLPGWNCSRLCSAWASMNFLSG